MRGVLTGKNRKGLSTYCYFSRSGKEEAGSGGWGDGEVAAHAKAQGPDGACSN